ncbi:MAG: SpoIIE family protein phosphatase [Bacteroidota bacterium]|nr:MAG: SpoIIE family protein phosphatase [Bacteroidota bacterium]
MVRILQIPLILIVFLFGTNLFTLAQTLDVKENDAQAKQYLDQGNKSEAARLYNQSAFYYRSNGQMAKAIEYYLIVLDLNTGLNNRVGQMLTHSNLSMLYIETEQYEQALKHLNAELKFREQSKKLPEILPVLLTIANVQSELKLNADALATTERSIEIAKEINDLTLIKRAYGVAYDVYTKAGKQDQAQAYFELYSAIDKKIKEDQMANVQSSAQQQVSEAYTAKAATEKELNVTSQELQKTVGDLQEAERIKLQQEMELNLQQALINEQDANLRLERVRKRFWAFGFGVALVFVFVLAFLVLKIISANKKIELQRQRLEKQNKEIKSSIYYAETIQKALLPDLKEISSFGDGFVIYRPKDIVSGDFYWFVKVSETRMFLSVVDCTGHGVPGAFMSMIGIRILSEIVVKMKIDSPASILEHLNEMVRNALRQEQTDNNDGMDLAVIRLDRQPDNSTLVTYSGAKRPLYIGYNSNNELDSLRPDRKSIGGHQPAKRFIDFADQTVKLGKDDVLYLFTDGIVDQNDPFRKKFGSARLENLLKSIIGEEANKQKSIMEEKIDLFMRDEAQRDDIAILGFKLK